MTTVTKQRGKQSPERGTQTMNNDTQTITQQGEAQRSTHKLDSGLPQPTSVGRGEL